MKNVNCMLLVLQHRDRSDGRPPLQSTPAGEPFECLGMEFKEVDMSNEGNRYAFWSYRTT